MAPKILSQAKIEATHNSRLCLALEEKPHELEGIVNTTMYTCPTLLTQEGERQYALHIHTDTCTCGYSVFIGNVLFALSLLPLMLPDVRSKPKPENILYFTKVIISLTCTMYIIRCMNVQNV